MSAPPFTTAASSCAPGKTAAHNASLGSLPSVQIIHLASGKCLQLDDEGLHIWDCRANDETQLFGFMKAEFVAQQQTPEVAEHYFIYAMPSFMCLGVSRGVFSQQTCNDPSVGLFVLADLGSDFKPPVLTAPTELAPVEAAGSRGAAVRFTVTAAYGLRAQCQPASGSVFPLGDTVVACSAIDAAGVVMGNATFVVSVGELRGRQSSCQPDLMFRLTCARARHRYSHMDVL